MSDIRTKLLLGTSITAVALMLALVSGMGLSTSEMSVSETDYKLLGHATVMAVNPDGITSYSQSDNIILTIGRDAAALRLFGTAPAGTAPFVCIQLGDGAGPVVADTDAGNDSALTNTFVECDQTSGESLAAATGAANEFKIVAIITINAADAPTDITEVALGNGTDGTTGFTGALSHFALATAIPVVDGTVVTVTYTMSTT